MVCLQGLILFGVLGGVWYVNYYYHLRWLEGYSYFTTLPDFAVIQAQFPDDALKYVGAFLLQLFYEPIWGAAIQAGFAVWIFLCGAMIVGCLFKSAVKMLWLTALPLPFFVFGQFWDLSLESELSANTKYRLIAAKTSLLFDVTENRPLLHLLLVKEEIL